MNPESVTHQTLFEVLRRYVLSDNPTGLQTDILFDVIRNINQGTVVNIFRDMQVSLLQHHEPNYRTRPRTRILRGEPIQPIQRQPKYNIKIVSLKKSLIEQEEECAICQDTHKKIEMTTVKDCNHCFGTNCLKNWTDICWTRDKKRASCPSCRKEMNDCVTYRARKTPERTPK
jgi:hypothetical protein